MELFSNIQMHSSGRRVKIRISEKSATPCWAQSDHVSNQPGILHIVADVFWIGCHQGYSTTIKVLKIGEAVKVNQDKNK